jgi:hypothetical protein
MGDSSLGDSEEEWVGRGLLLRKHAARQQCGTFVELLQVDNDD